MQKDAKNYDFTKIIKPEHAGKWVALSPDRGKIVGFSESLEKLARELGTDEVVYMKVREQGISYAF